MAEGGQNARPALLPTPHNLVIGAGNIPGLLSFFFVLDLYLLWICSDWRGDDACGCGDAVAKISFATERR